MKTKYPHRSQSESMNAALARIAYLSGYWHAWVLIVCVGVLGMGLAMTRARVRAGERSEDGLWEHAEQMTVRLRSAERFRRARGCFGWRKWGWRACWRAGRTPMRKIVETSAA